MSKEDESRDFATFYHWLTGRRPAKEFFFSSDPPDFVFDYRGKHVCVEHTHIFRSDRNTPFPPQQSDAIRKRIVARLKELFQKNPRSPISVDLVLGWCKTIKNGQEETTAKRIYDFIISQTRNLTEKPQHYYGTELANVSPELVQLIIAKSTDQATVTLDTGFCVVDQWGLLHIQEAVREKERGLAQYRKQYDECWLLLSANGSHPNEWIEPSEQACDLGVQSDFDRIFIVDSQPLSRCPVTQLRPKGSLALIIPDKCS